MTDLLVGTKRGLHELLEAGETRGVQLPDEDVVAIAPDGDAWWAITGRRAVWRAESTTRWEAVARLEGLEANCLSPSPAGLLVGTSEAHLLRLDRDVLAPVEGFEQADGRDEWYTPWGGPPDVRSISTGSSGTTHVNVHVGGIVRSTDGGATWEPTIDIHADVHQVLAPAAHAGLVVAACAEGMARSDDGGDTWRHETDGLHSGYCRAVAVGNGTVYLSASNGPRGGRGALYRRPIAGGRFEKCTDGLPEWFADNIDTACVAASGERVAFGTHEGSVFVSEDSGRTWAAWATGLPPVRCVALSVRL